MAHYSESYNREPPFRRDDQRRRPDSQPYRGGHHPGNYSRYDGPSGHHSEAGYDQRRYDRHPSNRDNSYGNRDNSYGYSAGPNTYERQDKSAYERHNGNNYQRESYGHVNYKEEDYYDENYENYANYEAGSDYNRSRRSEVRNA